MNTPLRIFLSYGHDANEELVRRIYADLKQRGHDVWFDKNDITFGDDWRRSITSGITECDRFFSFLSKHSTRDPGVCLDEIRIAIGAKGGNIQSILVESEQEVKLPPSISHIQWLDMHDWQDQRANGQAAWDAWYQEKLAEIFRVVESDESRKFAGEIRTLEEYLKPVVSDFAADARIQKLLEKKLTGRTWLFDAVEKWRTAADRSSRIFWMMGLPGFGKSFFAAHLAHFYGRGTVIGVHFCAYDKPDHRSAPRIIRTLAFQLATRLPDYRKLLLTLPEIAELDRKQTAAELFDYLLANPLKLSITGGRERLLIVIDALDEAGGDGRNELVEMLARHTPSLPDWIGLVVTSRPESDVRAPLQGLNPFVLDTATEANRADLREYLRHELAPQLQPRPDADRLVEQILEKSEGVFLYAEAFCEDVHKGYYSLDHPEKFPQGLGEKFFFDFQRYFPDTEQYEQKIEPLLGAILAAREPLPVEILQKLFGWRETELKKWLRKLGSLFPATTESGCEVIKPHHKSLADWLVDENKAAAYFVSVLEGHRMLTRTGLDDFASDPNTMLTYFLRHLPAHLLLQGDRARSRSLRENKLFKQARELRFYGKRRSMQVYISSTFRDMQAERDYLIRRTLPELNRLLDPHRIDVTAVDLRWGIPDDAVLDSDNGRALIFAEIDRCFPFFVGLIGNRYGWIPQGKNTSVVEDEVEYAAQKKAKMLLYFRRILLQSHWPAEVLSQFVDSGEPQRRMATFKTRLQQCHAVTTYECPWDAERNQVSGMQNFGSIVLNDLNRSALEVFGPHPQHGVIVSQRVQHDYTQSLLRVFVNRSDVIQQCISLVTSEQRKTVLLKGEQGVGKSAVLASVIEHLRTETGIPILVHHVGPSTESLTTRGVLESWCAQLEDWASRPVDSSVSPEELRREFSSRLELACKESNVIVALDNADWIESVSGEGSVEHLLQLLPDNVSVLVSSRDIIGTRQSQVSVMEMPPLSEVAATELIGVFLAGFSKRLSQHHLEIILGKACSRIPAFLVTSLRMLVTSVSGHEDLEKNLRDMPETFAGVCDWFLDSLELDYEVALTLSLLRKLTVGASEEAPTLKSLQAGEGEMMRRIYAVFPEHCTPPEDGLCIRPGALRSAIEARCISQPR